MSTARNEHTKELLDADDRPAELIVLNNSPSLAADLDPGAADFLNSGSDGWLLDQDRVETVSPEDRFALYSQRLFYLKLGAISPDGWPYLAIAGDNQIKLVGPEATLDKTLTPIETALVNCLLRRQSQTMSELVNSLGTGVDFSTRTQLRESFHKLLKLFNTIIPGSINKQGQHNMTRYSLGHDVLGVDLRPENSTPWFTEETAELMQDDQPTEGIPEPTLEAPRIATLDFLANLIAKKLHAMQELASTVGSEALDKIVDPQEQQSSQDNQMARSGQSIEPEAAKIQLAPVERPARRVNRGRGQRVWTSAIFNGHDTLDDNVSFVASNNPIVSNIMYGTTLKISDLQDLPRLKLVLDHVASYSSIRTEGPIRDRYGKLYNLWLKLSQR